MKQFLFPAVFIKTENEYTVVFPDLNITTEGDTLEEAYLFAKDYLRVSCCGGIYCTVFAGSVIPSDSSSVPSIIIPSCGL